MKIVVLGYIVRGPLGGLVWHHFQYVYGLHKMGHEVLFLEDSEEYAACYNPQSYELTTNPSYGLYFTKSIFSAYGLELNWAYFDFHTNQWFGRSKNEVMSFLRDADILLNISGVNPLRKWTIKIPKRVFIDTDPVFTQVKHLTDPEAFKLAKQHNAFFTFGENYGRSSCTIPHDGIDWKPTRQPVVIEFWKNSKIVNSRGKWTTVMQWDSYKTREWENVSYGMKSKSFTDYIFLPELLNEIFELALGSNTAPVKELVKHGWKIENPLKVTKTPNSYKNYIRNSKGEWSVAKHGYVITNSGWFSERSTAYLASSRPVVVQDTGFSNIIPSGEGIFAFSTMDEAIRSINEVAVNYIKHTVAAVSIAHEYFESSKVLQNILDKINDS